MIITVKNKEVINSQEISVHDGIMGPICYNYEDKSCTFEILNPEWNKRQTFHIKGILYYEVQSCEFAGPGANVFCWSCPKDRKRTKELFQRKVSEHYNSYSLLDEKAQIYFEHVFSFISEDQIVFICEEVEFHEYKYYEE